MMATGLDDLTSALFARIRHGKNESGSVLLKCPRCPNRLKALLLEVYQENGETYQKVWWVCRGLKSKTCIFPLNMPPQVFWTKRTAEQMRQDVIPLPNFNLLPKDYWKLYPSIFTKAIQVEDSEIKVTQRKIQGHLPMPVRDQEDEQFSKTSNVPEMITISEPETTPEDGTIPAEPEPTGIGEESSASEISKKKETSRKRKAKLRIQTDEDGRTLGKKQLKGNIVIPVESKRLIHPKTVKMLRLRPQDRRIITGGRNYDFKMMNEALPNKDSRNKKIFPDVQTSLKASLAMRFAQKEFSDRIADVIAENGMNLQSDDIHESRFMVDKTDSPVMIKQEKRSECTTPDSQNFENDLSDLKKMVESIRSIRKSKSLSSRMGIKAEAMETIPRRSQAMLSQFNPSLIAENFIPEQNSFSGLSNPSTSTASLDSNKSVVEKVQDNSKMEFNSPELSSIVQRNRRLIMSKRKKRRRTNEVHQSENQYVEQQFINYDEQFVGFDSTYSTDALQNYGYQQQNSTDYNQYYQEQFPAPDFDDSDYDIFVGSDFDQTL